jgi:SAM-dependent methyltransferase
MERFRNTGQPDWDWWSRLWPTPGETLRRLGVSEGVTVAEIGCGNGYFAVPAAEIAAPGTVYALDIDGALLDDCERIADRQGIDNLVTIQGDARELSDELTERVDALLIANTFHGVDDQSGLVQQIHDALRPGGRLAVLNWHDRPREETTVAGEPRGPPTELRLSPEETVRIVREASPFDLDRQVEFPPYHYAVTFTR